MEAQSPILAPSGALGSGGFVLLLILLLLLYPYRSRCMSWMPSYKYKHE